MSEKRESGTCDCCGNVYKKHVSGWDEYTRYGYVVPCNKCGFYPELTRTIDEIIRKNVEIVFGDDEMTMRTINASRLIEDMVKELLKKNSGGNQ